MRRFAALLAASVAALVALAPAAEAQSRRGEPLVIQVRPRSFLDAGKVVAPGSMVNPASAYGQTVSYLVSPPWNHHRDRFGEGVLPDPIGGPFIDARSPFTGVVDWSAPFGP